MHLPPACGNHPNRVSILSLQRRQSGSNDVPLHTPSRPAIQDPYQYRTGPILHIHFHGLHLRKQCVSLDGEPKLLSPIFLHISLHVPLRMPYTCPSGVPFGAPTRFPTHLPTGSNTKLPPQKSLLSVWAPMQISSLRFASVSDLLKVMLKACQKSLTTRALRPRCVEHWKRCFLPTNA